MSKLAEKLKAVKESKKNEAKESVAIINFLDDAGVAGVDEVVDFILDAISDKIKAKDVFAAVKKEIQNLRNAAK